MSKTDALLAKLAGEEYSFFDPKSCGANGYSDL